MPQDYLPIKDRRGTANPKFFFGLTNWYEPYIEYLHRAQDRCVALPPAAAQTDGRDAAAATMQFE